MLGTALDCQAAPPRIHPESIIYYPTTKLVFDKDMNLIGTGKIVNDCFGMRVKVTKY